MIKDGHADIDVVVGIKVTYDGEHRTARFSVSTGVKIEKFMRLKIRKNMKKIIEVYHSEYFIAKFAFR